MVGGYMTFQGIEGRARYHGTPVEDVLPVTIMDRDDRVEAPEGLKPRVKQADHPIVKGIRGNWPGLLGLNAVQPKPGAQVIATAGKHPLIVAGTFGKGRSVAFTSDCGPHWAPPEFVTWSGYGRLWCQLTAWVSGEA
jgi:uncharacterized membrane protein